MAIVNTGRRTIEVLPMQLWKDRYARGVRTVRVEMITPAYVYIRNIKTDRMVKVHLQDFVSRFDLEVGT